ncbi:hypothetical protein [Emticicia sp.]|uniref:hypothetical protein n=1 Tax=Emticicia sp. TaxID=1930953 RepID=UPI00375352CE
MLLFCVFGLQGENGIFEKYSKFFKLYNRFQTMQENNENQLIRDLGTVINNQVASVTALNNLNIRTGYSLDNQVIIIKYLSEISETLKKIERNQSK